MVFLAGVPVALAALVLSLFLKEVPAARHVTSRRGRHRRRLRHARTGNRRPGPPAAVAGLLRKEHANMSTVALAHAHSPLDEAEAWCVVKVRACQRKVRHGDGGGDRGQRTSPREGVATGVRQASSPAGYLAEGPDGLHLTDKGEQEFGTLSAAWQEWVTERLADWNPETEIDLPAALARLARRLFEEQPTDPVPVK